MRKMFSKLFIILGLVFLYTNSSFSQISVDADLYSRYNWRGIDFGNSPSFQPYITYTAGGFSIGIWGSYGFAGTGSVYSESDLWASYSLITGTAGGFTLIYTDYFFPYLGLKYSNYKSNGNGAHTLEGGLSYNGPTGFPISISGYINFRNDPDNSSYFQIGYPFNIGDIGLTVFAGASGGKSAAYGTNKFTFINTGLTFKKNVIVTDKFNIPVTASLIYNPNPSVSTLYLVFGITI